MDSPDLALNGIIISVGAGCPLVTRHVHTHNVQMLGQILEQQKEASHLHSEYLEAKKKKLIY